MTRSGIRDLPAGLLVFLLTTVTMAAEAQVGPQRFNFETKLWAPAFANHRRELQRGALLLPLFAESQDEYQLVVLCENLELHFDEDGFSQPVHVQGFCRVAGFKAVVGTPENFKWKITAAIDPEIRTAGCDPALLQAKREKQMKPKGPWGDLGQQPAPWYRVHDQPFQECLASLEKDVKELQKDVKGPHVDLQTLTGEQVCYLTTPSRDHKTREWIGCRLDCWPQLLERR